LLVLAGPGTGKTTTLVEAVARRVERGEPLDQLLVLTFSRRAAMELRERIAARLGQTTAGPAAWTFHAWCYALVRAAAPPDAFREPLRLLSGPEQDVVLRDLLSGSLDLRRPEWPAPLRPAITRRGMAEEVRALLARAREVGLGPDDLAALAIREGRADWSALADFFAEYLDVLDATGAIDYAELVSRAAALAATPEWGQQLQARYRAVFVDEYQDTDPAQERLLRALAGGGRDLVVVGDPDQAIYAFRGAEVSGLLEFPDRFASPDGRPADVIALRTCRRSVPELVEVSRRLAWRIPAPGLPVEQLRQHRELVPAGTASVGTESAGTEPAGTESVGTESAGTESAGTESAGAVEVRTYPSVGAEAEAIADTLRREHLEHDTPWGRMAVLVRSGVRSIPLLRRVLSAAGVPVEVAGDELPLAREPAVAPLLLALRCADALRTAAGTAEVVTEEAVRLLLTGPLVRCDPATLRRLGRELRAWERAALAADPRATTRLPRPATELIRTAVLHPKLVRGMPDTLSWPIRRLADLLDGARTVLTTGGDAQDALWSLWDGSPWSRRLVRDARGSGEHARAADRDLDAVVALVAAVGRASERRSGVAGNTTLLDELEAQQIPGDTLAERATRGDSVRLLTAHRSKGLEWDVVVVSGVQDGGWPDLRRRSSLLEAERLDPPERGGLREPVSRAELLVDERRLFYVACTRARRRLLVTAVAGTDEDGVRPSRFLEELGVPVVAVKERLSRPLSLPAVVAQLRRLTVDPDVSEAMRAAAAQRLARLAVLENGEGRRLVPAANPDSWWGLLPVTESDRAVRDLDKPVPLSGTSLTGLQECPLRWFLEHEVHAEARTSSAMGFGGVVHALAHDVARGRTPAELPELMRRLDSVWGQLAYDAPWQSDLQREQAREALDRFLTWHAAARGRTLVGTEVGFETVLEMPEGLVKLRGSIDRLEIDADGAVHVVDLKTGRAPSDKSVRQHPQLGIYQLVVGSGALADSVPPGAQAGGAELVQLRTDQDGGPRVQPQPALPPDGAWIKELLSAALQRVLAEDFRPTPGDRCDRCAFRRACPAQPDGRQVVA
jgi:superfamily I DNA/RNA helicase/RecB family exonuclease